MLPSPLIIFFICVDFKREGRGADYFINLVRVGVLSGNMAKTSRGEVLSEHCTASKTNKDPQALR